MYGSRIAGRRPTSGARNVNRKRSHPNHAAKNIGMRNIRVSTVVSADDNQLALESGTVTPKRGFTAHPHGYEAEFTNKSHPQHAEGGRVGIVDRSVQF